MGIAQDLIFIIASGLLLGLAAHLLRIPPIIGYILAGIIIGPVTGLIAPEDLASIELLAEVGVALLLFSIGLDFSFREIKGVKSIALIGTTIQIVITTLAGFGLALSQGFSWNTSLTFGMLISLSSTMVVLKTLMNRGLTGTLSAKVMIGILIVQDLAAIPLMIIIPGLAGDGIDPVHLAAGIAQAVAILTGIVLLGAKVLPHLLHAISRTRSRELFLVTVTTLALGIGYLTHLAGLSLAIGAFVAGMVISESDYSHRALADIIPLRDIFGMVFFTSIGLLLDPRYIMGNIGQVAFLSGTVLFIKFAVFILLGFAFGYRNIVPLAMGLTLSQIGEFSFVLARVALSSGTITREFYTMILSVSIVTMTIAPFLAMLAAPIYSFQRKFKPAETVETINMPTERLEEHVVIAGGGRVGALIASLLYRLGHTVIVIEQEFRAFEILKSSEFPVIYGDASQEPVLSAAKIESCKLMIITIPSIIPARGIIDMARHSRPDLPIIARANDVHQLEELYSLGVHEAVQPELEASLEILRQSLLGLGHPIASINNLTDSIRAEHYRPLRARSEQDAALSRLKNTPFLLVTNWATIPSGSPLAEKRIGDCAVRTRTGSSIVGVFREGAFIPNPGPDFTILPGDLVATIGSSESSKKFEDYVDQSCSDDGGTTLS